MSDFKSMPHEFDPIPESLPYVDLCDLCGGEESDPLHPSSLRAAYRLINEERDKQRTLGYTSDHDDTHSLSDWADILGPMIIGLKHHAESFGWTRDGITYLVEIAAVAIAAVQAAERRQMLPGRTS